ncbi:ATP-binding protein [Candidatus Nitrosocosmicus franklandus]|uniref:histidine kinase n=1 Tax=Candidatus Nitrosocosmicus franklandianus TaxID=1798806 RepID=A0A484I619_9ARCH|nr:ATP-binding protein [Candidatus Nitrosocosmicus franklandus]VFJ13138.1 Sensor protein DivL [Candidatus Nitrosocosmicus franklandus]
MSDVMNNGSLDLYLIEKCYKFLEIFSNKIFLKYTLIPSILLILLAVISADPYLWLGSELHHFYIELFAVILSGVIAFYYILHARNLNDKFSLFIGIGFAVSASIDLLHVAVSYGLMEHVDFLKYFIPQTWFAGRIFLSSMLLVAIAKYSFLFPDELVTHKVDTKASKTDNNTNTKSFLDNDRKKKYEEKLQKNLIIYLILLAAIAGSIAGVSFIMIFPASVVDEYSIHRPYEIPPLVIFLLALFFFYKKKLYLKKDVIYKGILLYLVIDIFSQIIMSYSIQSFDTAHNVAHVLKDLGYFVNIIALAISGIRFTLNLKERNELIQKQYEKIKESEKLKDEFINIAAHELRTPIQPILALSIFLYKKNGNIDEYKEHLEIIIKNSKRLQKLSEEILDAARIESRTLSLNLEKFDIIPVLHTMIRDYTNQIGDTNVTIDLYYENVQIDLNKGVNGSKHSLVVYADKDRIHQVLSNILINAIKFTEKGNIEVGVKRGEDRIFIRVRDSGEGINKNVLSRLFNKFNTSSPSGTGLGLYICRNIIEAHGGRIWAENNKESKGATFTFTLPNIPQK